MFEKFARIEDRSERLEIYNLLKFNLSACLRLVEFLALAVLISGLGWFIGLKLSEPLGRIPGGLIALGLMLLVFGLVRLPLLYLSGTLAADFGLDPRPASRRLKSMILGGLRRLALVWLISAILYLGLIHLNLWLWTLSALALGAILITLDAFFPCFWRGGRHRPLNPGELSPELLARIDQWTPKTGLASKAIVVSAAFSPELTPPFLEGLGRTMRLVIPEKNLIAFTPRELSVLVVTRVVAALIKAPLKFLLLRFCALAVAVPLASILLSTLGAGLWAYPLTYSPALLALVWAGAWIGAGAAEFTILLTRRSMDTQLAAVAAMILKDEEALPAALAVLAEKNLEETNSPAWREIFRPRFNRQTFINRAKYHQHMSKFTEE